MERLNTAEIPGVSGAFAADAGVEEVLTPVVAEVVAFFVSAAAEVELLLGPSQHDPRTGNSVMNRDIAIRLEGPKWGTLSSRRNRG